MGSNYRFRLADGVSEKRLFIRLKCGLKVLTALPAGEFYETPHYEDAARLQRDPQIVVISPEVEEPVSAPVKEEPKKEAAPKKEEPAKTEKKTTTRGNN